MKKQKKLQSIKNNINDLFNSKFLIGASANGFADATANTLTGYCGTDGKYHTTDGSPVDYIIQI